MIALSSWTSVASLCQARVSQNLSVIGAMMGCVARATWPHMMVRAMLTEQLYRAAAIATGHPYHRGG